MDVRIDVCVELAAPIIVSRVTELRTDNSTPRFSLRLFSSREARRSLEKSNGLVSTRSSNWNR